MKTPLALLIGLVFLATAGCAPHRLAGNDIHPFDGEVQLQYPPSSGHIDVTLAAGERRFQFNTQQYSLDYTVRPEGDVLHWQFTAVAKIYGIDHNKRADPKTLDDVLRLYNLKDSHEKLTVEIETDLLGNPLRDARAVEEDETDPEAELDDAYWQVYYRKVFSMLILPFSASHAAAGAVVSHGHPMVPVKYATHFGDTEILLSGQKTLHGHECLVFEYKATSRPYKNRYRQKVTDSVDAALVVDKETKVLREARSVYRTKNVTYYLKAAYSDPTPDVVDAQ